MKYEDLSPDQHCLVQSFMDTFRPNLGDIARALGRMSKLEDAWLIIGPIVEALDDGEEIKTTTGLAGAVTLRKENLVRTMEDFKAVMNLFYTPENRAAYIAAAGLANTL